MILLNDFQRQWADTRADVLDATERVGASGWYILGKNVESFERALAASFDRAFAVGCASGLDAIEIALRALGLRPGDKVLTTPLSAFATTLAILRAGGVPVFVDVDDHGLIDLARCEERLATGDIRAFVPVHLYGQPLPLPRLAELQARFAVALVEDCAQSALARFRGRSAGTVGAIAATSFYPTKNLGALGDGGALLTDDPALRDRCASLRNYGQTARYQHDELGLNSRLDELQAAILAQAFLPRLPAWTERRRRDRATLPRRHPPPPRAPRRPRPRRRPVLAPLPRVRPRPRPRRLPAPPASRRHPDRDPLPDADRRATRADREHAPRSARPPRQCAASLARRGLLAHPSLPPRQRA